MPKYFFTAKSQKGEPYSGNREAKDEYDLAKILRQEGYILISAATERKERKFKLALSVFSFLSQVSFKDKMTFTKNLQVMIGAGVSLPKALNTFAEQSSSKKFRKILKEISDKITRGENFSNALAGYPNVFSNLFCSMVKIGEESGSLEKNLGVLSRQMEREYELKSKITSALIYPAVIVLAMMGIGIAMLILVVPKLAETFKDLNVELPLTTKIVIFIGTFLSEKWYLVILLLATLIVLFNIFLKTKTGKKAMDGILIKIPIIAPLVKKTNATYTVRTLSALITAGVPMLRSLEIIGQTLGNVYFKNAILEATEKIKKGSKLSDALKPYRSFYSLTVIQMIQVGEETGETSKVLDKLSDFFEEEIATATKNLAAVIEPALMLLVGGVVGFFAISMVQPMYSMLQGIK